MFHSGVKIVVIREHHLRGLFVKVVVLGKKMLKWNVLLTSGLPEWGEDDMTRCT